MSNAIIMGKAGDFGYFEVQIDEVTKGLIAIPGIEFLLRKGNLYNVQHYAVLAKDEYSDLLFEIGTLEKGISISISLDVENSVECWTFEDSPYTTGVVIPSFNLNRMSSNESSVELSSSPVDVSSGEGTEIPYRFNGSGIILKPDSRYLFRALNLDKKINYINWSLIWTETI